MKNNKASRVAIILSTSDGWDLPDYVIAEQAGCSEVYVATLRRKLGAPAEKLVEQQMMVINQLLDMGGTHRNLASALDRAGLMKIIISYWGEKKVSEIVKELNEREAWQGGLGREKVEQQPILPGVQSTCSPFQD